MSEIDPLVSANPVIDDDWYEKEITEIRHKLAAEFPALDPETIGRAVELATTRVAAPARIPNFLPVLVLRDARDWLAEHTRSTDA